MDAKGIEPPAHWPSRDGKIEVQGLTARYAPEMDPVLKDVTFTVLPREKIGICGRTGSGKSTLALTFFRFMEADSGEPFLQLLHEERKRSWSLMSTLLPGLIKIDGLDIAKMSLSTLRDRLTIIPQEAQLTSGTIRDNLDPFNRVSRLSEPHMCLADLRLSRSCRTRGRRHLGGAHRRKDGVMVDSCRLAGRQPRTFALKLGGGRSGARRWSERGRVGVRVQPGGALYS